MWLMRKNQDGAPPPSKLRIATVQILATIVANLPSISPGMVIGFSGIALPLMHQEATLNTEQSSWIASSASAAAPIGCLMAGVLCERLGRRGALIAVNFPCFLGWLLVAFIPTTESRDLPLGGGSGSMAQLIAGRVLTGLATGMASSPSPVLISEVASPKLRGMLVCWNSVAISLGILIVYLLGAFLPWRIVAGLSAIFPVLSIIFLLTVAESPVWLLTKGKVDKAREALTFYRAGHVARAEAEFSQALEAAAHKAQINRRRRSSTMSMSFAARSSSFLASLLRPEVYKPFLILNGYFLFQQLSGTFVVTYYAVDIVRDSGVTGIDPFIATVFIGLVRLVICIGVSLGMKRLGRRAPSIISGAGMTVTMAALAIYVTVSATSVPEITEDPLLEMGAINATETTGKGIGIPAQAWVPLISLLGYIALATLGFLTLPWAMMGEVFPNSVRGPASGLTSALAYVISFGILKAFPGMAASLGAHGAFFVFCAFSLLGTIFVTLWLPETQGKRLSEIEKDFAEGPCLQLCRKTRFGEKKKPLPTRDPSVTVIPEADAEDPTPRELVTLVADQEAANSEEQPLQTADQRQDVPMDGKLDV
ncbi:facilitated trehalose transporter Tret1-2 homolog isoform X2 [Ischnura elegans]|nr:facilitated trehalose transporter Tret1-2 homolog isoform X2 [Ischnura elegans]XP_046396892.1 facilitated trehalose transporter Tret1-2 homolog isoform X2 [Ischnura elegans]